MLRRRDKFLYLIECLESAFQIAVLSGEFIKQYFHSQYAQIINPRCDALLLGAFNHITFSHSIIQSEC